MTSRFKVLLYEAMHAEGTKLLEKKCDVIYAKSFEESHLISLVGDVDAIVIRANGAVSRLERVSSRRIRLKSSNKQL